MSVACTFVVMQGLEQIPRSSSEVRGLNGLLRSLATLRFKLWCMPMSAPPPRPNTPTLAPVIFDQKALGCQL